MEFVGDKNTVTIICALLFTIIAVLWLVLLLRSQPKQRKLNFVPKAIPHTHVWKSQYRTGNVIDGKSDLCKCRDCPQWAVRHYGKSEYILID